MRRQPKAFDRVRSGIPSLEAKSLTKPQVGAVVAAGEAGRRPVVPVAVERDIP